MAFTVSDHQSDLPFQWVHINGISLHFLLDSGSTITTIDSATYNKHKHALPQLEKFPDQVQGYPHSPLAVVGQFTATVAFGDASASETIVVVA